jgi:hypothetical protein
VAPHRIAWGHKRRWRKRPVEASDSKENGRTGNRRRRVKGEYMIIVEALKYLVGLGERTPFREQIHGVEYSDRNLVPVKPPSAEMRTFSRLGSFAEFVKMHDDLGSFVHIVSPYCVEYVGPLREGYQDRETFACATFDTNRIFKFAQYMTPEMFVIGVQTMFRNTVDRDRLLELAGGIMSEQIVTSSDDGVSQTVAVRSGISLVRRETIANPFELAPWRTFPEIESPASKILLRARQNKPGELPALALFETDNGFGRSRRIR